MTEWPTPLFALPLYFLFALPLYFLNFSIPLPLTKMAFSPWLQLWALSLGNKLHVTSHRSTDVFLSLCFFLNNSPHHLPPLEEGPFGAPSVLLGGSGYIPDVQIRWPGQEENLHFPGQQQVPCHLLKQDPKHAGLWQCRSFPCLQIVTNNFGKC